MSTQPSKSGIVTDESSGERHIPESVRADGSTRKAIKIRPGYRPPEDVEVYKNRTAETFRGRGKGGIPGAEAVNEEPASSASNKNAKRREARKKAKAAEETQATGNGTTATSAPADSAKPAQSAEASAQAEAEKKARNLKKKLKQAKELQDKRDTGEALLPEQIAKVIKINELIRELDALGLGADGEPKDQAPSADEKKPA